MTVNFLKTSEHARLPERSSDHAAGYDLFASETVTVPPGKWKLVPLDLIWIPEDNTLEMQIRPRSGLALKKGVTVLNTPGTIDADYRGKIGVILFNHSGSFFQVSRGDRVAQAVFNIVAHPKIELSTDFSDTDRGSGGFGSTGV